MKKIILNDNYYLLNMKYRSDAATSLYEVICSFKDIITPDYLGTWVSSCTQESIMNWHEQAINTPTSNYYLIIHAQNDNIIGLISNEIKDHQYNIGYYLHHNYWNKNIMTQTLINFCLNTSNIDYIRVHPNNLGSKKVIEGAQLFTLTQINENILVYKFNK